MFNILKRTTHVLKYQGYQTRNKITLSKLNASDTSTVKRPTPILLLRTKQEDISKDSEWAISIQNQFSQLGYFTVDATVTLPEKNEKELLLQTCYQELSKATSDLSFFPPLLISHGEIASRISQKFVSNKPVSGLIMIEDPNDNNGKLNELEFPISEFEPRFPIFMISNHSPPEFLDGWIDQVELKQGNEFKDILQWMDELGM